MIIRVAGNFLQNQTPSVFFWKKKAHIQFHKAASSFINNLMLLHFLDKKQVGTLGIFFFQIKLDIVRFRVAEL